jgi:hypothetical protein
MGHQSTVHEILAAAQGAMGNAGAIAAITSITALADCTGPHGAYTTEILSARGDRLMFRQVFPDRPSFVAVVNGAQAWARDETTGEIERLDAASIAGIRSHEFQMIALTMAERFADPVLVERTQFAGRTCQVVRMTGQLGFPHHVYFADDGLWMGMIQPDSRAPEHETIRVTVNAWRRVEGVLLPSRVTATDASGDFVLDFRMIALNTVDDELFIVPPELATQSDPMTPM